MKGVSIMVINVMSTTNHIELHHVHLKQTSTSLYLCSV